MESETEQKMLAQALIAAAARHDVVAVKNLLRTVSANVQDDETGFTPLHAAVAGCSPPHEKISSDDVANEVTPNATSSKGTPISSETEDQAAEIVRVLFENGAIWNDIDALDETAACIAWRLGLKRVYQSIVDAGVRAELLLNRLAELEDSHESEDEDDDEEDNTAPAQEEKTANESDIVVEPKEKVQSSLKAATTADPESNRATEPPSDYIDHWDSNAAFLRSSLRFTPSQLLDSSSNAVMMDWETTLMRRHAELLLPRSGLRALNIGHGMGIVDAAIQSHKPATHHIVEAHPAVLARMREQGWFERPGVKVHEGRWQDVLPRLVEEGIEVDAIYYDTFAEDYKDFKDLFSEHVIGLLDQNGKFGFYNGLGADRRVCYDVYTNVSEFFLLLLSVSV